MKEYWLKYAAFVDSKTERERAIIALIFLALIFVLVDTLLLGELLEQRSERAQAIDALDRDMSTLELEVNNAQLSQTALGSSGLQEKNNFMQTLERLELAVADAAQGFIPASAMPLALEQILERSNNLAMVHLENKPVELVSGAGADPKNILYRHGVQFKMKGSYTDSMEYLKQLEQLQWRIDWNAMSFDVVNYPQGILTIEVFTYSNEKDWISV